MAKWRRCVFLGEAAADLLVMMWHFDKQPHADEGDLHELTRVGECRSTKQAALARAAKSAGLEDWARNRSQLESLGGAISHDDISSSECWKAAIGALVVDISP